MTAVSPPPRDVRIARAPGVARHTSGVVAAAFAFVVAACGGGTDQIARFDNVVYDAELHPINGSPLSAPTAINTGLAAVVRADPNFDFDLAVDLDAQGRAVLLTQRAVGVPASGAGRQVSLQFVTGGFEAVERAPDNDWIPDSLLTVTPGQVVAVRAGTPVCAFDFSPYVYSKLVVDSVSASQRRVWLTLLTNPNCGFRSLQPGRPRN